MTIDPTLINRAAHLLRGAEQLAVLTGAGISKESGVPTFRDALEGLWAKHDPQQLATPGAFHRDPKLVYDWYMYRREILGDAVPNPGHHALVALEAHIADVVIITQNVDGFHALVGSSDVIELHGNLSRDTCYQGCPDVSTEVTPAAATAWRQADPPEPPRCPRCGGFMRPDVVWFGEALPAEALHRARQVSEACDVMLVVGTSGVVQPAASMPYWALRSGAKLIDVNPGQDQIGQAADVFLQGPAGEVLPRVVEALGKPGDA